MQDVPEIEQTRRKKQRNFCVVENRGISPAENTDVMNWNLQLEIFVVVVQRGSGVFIAPRAPTFADPGLYCSDPARCCWGGGCCCSGSTCCGADWRTAALGRRSCCRQPPEMAAPGEKATASPPQSCAGFRLRCCSPTGCGWRMPAAPEWEVGHSRWGAM